MTGDGTLLALAIAGVLLLVLLITRLRLNPFLALLSVSLLVGGAASVLGVAREDASGRIVPYSLAAVVGSMSDGLAATLGGIAAILGLGAMLGTLLAESGGAEVLAERLARGFGPKQAHWAMAVLALLVGLATWFAVGLVLLAPILISLTRRTGQPYMRLALPMLAFLSGMHGLMPPHPGPVVAVEALGADMGWVLLWGLAVGVPAALMAGPGFAAWVVGRVPVDPPPELARPEKKDAAVGIGTVRRPGFGLTLTTILLPLVLMVLATLATFVGRPESGWRQAAALVGHPTVALLVSVLLGSWSLGTRCGYRLGEVLKFTERGVAGVGMTILVVGGGGAFARVLRDCGAADAIGRLAEAADLSPLFYGWLMAACIRLATGSATVAIVTAAGLLAPVVGAHPEYTPHQVALIVCAMGTGSLFLSHLNDGGFWIVKDGLGLNLGQTLRTWSVSETILATAGLVIAWGLFGLVG